jgi:putative oxidoreductase
MLVLGYMTRWGAAILIGFLVAVTWIFHSTPDQKIQLLKNLAIIGGLLQIVAFGPGEMSLDGRDRTK